MIALDTNLLLRLLVNDAPGQAAKVRALFDAHADEPSAFWIADVVLAEIVWALDRSYGRSRSEISMALHALSHHANVLLESAAVMGEALVLFEEGPAHFVDCLLAAKARAAGCSSVHTFDRKMRGLPGVQLL
ncbi:MAG: PIN domain-containing protein [Burkholderiales bacterium]